MPQNPSIPFSSQRVVGISSSFLRSPTAWPRNAEMLSPPSVTCSLVVGVLPWQLGNVGLNLLGRGKPRTRLAFLGQVVLTTGLQHKWWGSSFSFGDCIFWWEENKAGFAQSFEDLLRRSLGPTCSSHTFLQHWFRQFHFAFSFLTTYCWVWGFGITFLRH